MNSINLKQKIPKDKLKKYLNIRFILIGLIFLAVFMMFTEFFKAFLLTAIFIPLGIFTSRWGKMVPHVSPETVTASGAFMGYMFGPTVGFMFGLFGGLFCYVKNSMISMTYITVCIMAGLSGILSSYLKTGPLHLDFLWAFGLTILIRNLVSLPLFMFVISPNPVENITHHITHAFFNILVVMPLLQIILTVLSLF